MVHETRLNYVPTSESIEMTSNSKKVTAINFFLA